MKRLLIIQSIALVLVFLTSSVSFGQSAVCSDDFSDATIWTPVNSNATVANNVGSFTQTQCGADNRCWRQLTEPCSGTAMKLNNEAWVGKISFTPTYIYPGGVAHLIMSFCSSNGDPLAGNTDCIGIEYYSEINDPTNSVFKIFVKNAGSWDVSSQYITSSLNTTYYFRLTRQQGVVTLESCNSTYSTVNSTISYTNVAASVENLGYLSFGALSNGSSTRRLTGTIDNFSVDGLENTEFDESFHYFPNENWFDWLTSVYVPQSPGDLNYGTSFFNAAADGASDRRVINEVPNVGWLNNNCCTKSHPEKAGVR